MSERKGQVLVIVAVLIPITLLFLAVAIDAGRLHVEHARLARAAQAGADAGISVVAEHMVTLAVARQTSGPVPSGTPDPGDPLPWLQDDDRATLVSEEARGTAIAVARDYVNRNVATTGTPAGAAAEVIYPSSSFDPYDPGQERLALRVRLERRIAVLLTGLLRGGAIELQAEGAAEIPVR